MKITIVALLIFMIIFLFCLYFNNQLNYNINDILADIDSLNKLIEQKDYEEAKEVFFDMEGKWKEKEDFISLLLEHSELDKINELLAELKADFTEFDFNEYYRSIYKLQFFMNHLIDKNKLNTETIL